MKFNQRGSALVAVLAIAIILNVTLLTFFFITRDGNKASGNRKLDITALNIAEAGKEHFYAQVINNICLPLRDSAATWFSDEPFKNGHYSVSYRANGWADTLWITSKGFENNTESIIDVIAKVNPYLTINNPPVRGAITTHSRIEVTGNIVVDGRDHDTLCDSTAPGVYGVSTCDSLTVEGNSRVGGRGYEPKRKNQFEAIRPYAAEENVPASSLFDSPESFLGLLPGSLDAFKSGDCTVPENFRALIYRTCDDVGPVKFGSSAAGILIVHNATKTAKLTINTGEFKGLIITDDFNMITGNVTIHGAIVVLRDSMVVINGVGTGRICYSSDILMHLSSYCNNFRKSMNELMWKEQAN
jgi:hypothetical protein